ncbi:hypothetical protein [uncultured Tenacibaculum sp.]|uniref:hypothetical protein n=1 Tax=uncultured Tenacibaculum sp. TaxID=174713 RepID=UPI00261F5E9D|nr:hypothetical protein [uncultured Tenacibaculum sp.]
MKKNCLIILTFILVSCGSSVNLNLINQYKFNEFEDCRPGGVETFKYKYRIGKWIFYYPDGKIKAKGSYELIQSYISTRCRLDEKLEFSKMANDWEFYDQNGQKINSERQVFSELNCVTHELDDFLEIQYCFDEKQNRVINKIITN